MSKETRMTTLMGCHEMSSSSGYRRLLAGLAATVCVLVATVLLPGSALAQSAPVPACPTPPAPSATNPHPTSSWCATTFNASTINADGSADTQAGSHPFESTTTFAFSTDASGFPSENMKDISVQLPAGFIGDPNATPKCSVEQLDANSCPAASQIGQLTLSATVNLFNGPQPVFNMVPPAGVAAQFGTNLLLLDAFINVSVRTGGDYGLSAGLNDTSTLLPLFGSSLTLWGVPGDSSHDTQRVCPGQSVGTPCPVQGGTDKPFLTMPTQCGPMQFNLVAASWQGDTTASSFPGGDVNGCGVLSFDPSINVGVGTPSADSPTAVSVDVHVPQAPDNPVSLATPSLKSAVVTLPQGIALSPAAADGLQACSEAQFGPDTSAEPTCPNASKIGTAEIDSPISADPLTGGIFLAQQNANPFGSTFAIYVATEADGTLIKLAAKIDANPATGQLTTTFDGMPAFGGNPAFVGNPQLPFSDFKLNFFGGPRAALMTGETCGTFSGSTDIQPWSAPDSGADSTPVPTVTIGAPCGGGFSPTFAAGSANAQAGAFSPFALSFTRSDSDQDLSGLTVTLPPGVSAKLANVPLCSDADIAAAQGKTGAAELASPSCPASTQVGTVETGAGPGSDPFFLSGKVYLTGPFDGAPYGLVVIVPAVAGPLDLGNVVIRQALNVDPTDAHVTVTSQPFPTILDGVPLRLRRVDVDLNRSDFTVNPTSCNAMSINATLTSTGGATANDSSHFQVGGCLGLAFSPKLKLSLSGKGQNKSGKHPTLTANLTQPSGQANIHLAKVTLPLALALDPSNSKHVCAFATAQAVHGGAVGCPTSTIVGTATAKTPLLSQPLSGKVYLVQGTRTNAQGQQIKTLPSLLIPLRGQFALDLRAQTSVSNGKLVTTFPTVPDVPVSSFKLTLTGGKKGLLVITGRGRSICGRTQTSSATLDAQSGKQVNSSIKMATPCKGASTHHKKSKKHKKHKK
jgi:hypothetical protein